MAVKINNKAIVFLNSLIRQGKVNTTSWSFSAADGNKLLGDNNDWETYGKVHLAVNDEFESDTKEHYMFPVAKMAGNEIQIFRRGVIAAKSAASGGRGAPGRPKIAAAADKLLQAIDKNDSVDVNNTEDKTVVGTYHIDEVFNGSNYHIEKASLTPEGFLKGRAIVTNIGIFRYQTQDGEIINELRTPEEVGNSESLKTLKNIPITDTHPQEMITSENIENLQKQGVIIGTTGSYPYFDGTALSIDYVITNKSAIDKLKKDGLKAVSCGYRAKIDMEHGMAYGNNPYDAVQRDIRYNHVATCIPAGRAGDLAQITLDSINENIHVMQKIENKGDVMPEKITTTSYIIDGVGYDIEKDVAKHIHALEKDVENKEKLLIEANAKKDAFEAEIKKLKEDAEKSKLDDAAVQTAVKERLAMEKLANFLELKVDENTGNSDLKKQIIKKHNNVDLTGREDSYINAYYDSVKDMITQEMVNKPKEQVFGQTVQQKTKHVDSYAEQIKKAQAQYKGSMYIQNGNVKTN